MLKRPVGWRGCWYVSSPMGHVGSIEIDLGWIISSEVGDMDVAITLSLPGPSAGGMDHAERSGGAIQPSSHRSRCL